WPVVSRPVILRCGQQSRIIGKTETLHQRRDELVGWQTTELLVFRRYDYIETARRGGDSPALGEAVQGEFGGGGGDTQRILNIIRAEEIAATSRKTGDVFANVRMVCWFRFHLHKVSLSDTLRNRCGTTIRSP